MFTGIIEEIGVIKSIKNIGGGKRIAIQCTEILKDSKVDDSISVNGICQTIVKFDSKCFEFDSVEETLKKTTIKYWSENYKVNLERALKLSDRLGGHFVLGHVDTIGRISHIKDLTSSKLFEISYPSEYNKYVIPKGSITINGISLTIAESNESAFVVSIIPHTISKTTLKDIKIGDFVNLEFDIIGKYIEKLLQRNSSPNLTLDKLEEMGF